MPRPRSERKIKIGDSFGKLTVIAFSEDSHRPDGRAIYTYLCRCECGREKVIEEPSLVYGKTISCGHHSQDGRGGARNPNGHRFQDGICFMDVDGKICELDEEDYPMVRQYNWHLNRQGYAVARNFSRSRQQKGGTKFVKMHSLIAGRRNIDHADGNRLNNRKSNLRPYDIPSENAINKPLDAKNKTGYIGVYRRKNGKFCARLQWKRKQMHLGTYDTPEKAAMARDKKVKVLCNGFARLNFPE